ncbi:hypothetical protein BVG19_g902 [[Candida] boidinii]|nr:hypothetical protein BVG19_g902 [[Candida] boidinii]OWB48701.1 hypothetical protein B5S27_g236 [[Candida] boidinii]
MARPNFNNYDTGPRTTSSSSQMDLVVGGSSGGHTITKISARNNINSRPFVPKPVHYPRFVPKSLNRLPTPGGGVSLFNQLKAMPNSSHGSIMTKESLPENLEENPETKIEYDEGPVNASIKFHESGTSMENVIVDSSLVPWWKDNCIGEIESLEDSSQGVSKKLLFVYKKSESLKVYPQGKNLTSNINSSQVSIQSTPFQTLMDLKHRGEVIVREKELKDVEADVVEVYVKDLNLSRGDMWNLSSKLVGTCVHKTQKLSFLNGSIRGLINKIYRNGKKVFSAYVSEKSKIVFRSESAKLVVFIQISSEMWHFEENGQQMFHKLMNSLFPKLFHRWKDLGTNHLITIVLFTSLDLNEGHFDYSPGEKPKLLEKRQDYYRVVVDQVSIVLWSQIMSALRSEFSNFERSIKVMKNEHRNHEHPEEFVIRGRFLPTVKGNLLEAINLGATLVTDDFRDPDLRHTTNHFVIISPGTGIFDVDYDVLLKTSRLMLCVDCTIDVICLSQPALHVVPLFRYKDENNKLQHCKPSWMDISFWNEDDQAVSQWLPRCKIYELQMMGVMENDKSALIIKYLDERGQRSIMNAMDNYDSSIFAPVKKTVEKQTVTTPVSATPGLKVKEIGHSSPIADISTGTEETTQSKSSESSPNFTLPPKRDTSAFLSLKQIKEKTSTPNLFKRFFNSPSIRPVQLDDSFEFGEKSNDDIKSLNLNDGFKGTMRLTTSVQEFNKKKKNISSDTLDPTNRKSLNDKPCTKEEKKSFIFANYWTHVGNPSNAATAELKSMVSYGRWQYVFPKNVKSRSIKWTSLSSPAALPLTTPTFPHYVDFSKNFTFTNYDVRLSYQDQNTGCEILMRQMISIRLSLGFQICVGSNVYKAESRATVSPLPGSIITYLSPDNIIGCRVYMILGNEIHRIFCDYNNEIKVQLFKRNESVIKEILDLKGTNSSTYEPFVRTRYAETFSKTPLRSLTEDPRVYNWNKIDQALAGYEDTFDDNKNRMYRMKFVVLPSAVSSTTSMNFSFGSEKLSDEEIRLEGIRNLIGTINKNRYRTPEEREREKTKGRKEETIPEINFYTGSLFNYLSNTHDQLKSGDNNNSSSGTNTDNKHSTYSLFSSFNKNSSLVKIAIALQGEEGIKVINRVWHVSLHLDCFVGSELVPWLIKNFSDINTVEEAVDYGNVLMKAGLFSHVSKQHSFLGGHYFYVISPEYKLDHLKKSGQYAEALEIDEDQDSDDDTSNSDIRAITAESETGLNDTDRSIKKTSSAGSNVKNSVSQEEDKGDDNKSEDINSLSQSIDSKTFKNTRKEKEKQKVILSRSIVCDLDPQHKSWQPEKLTVHYDVVHNPDHCFHIRLEWLNVTSKLIEDTINSWSRDCYRHGLSLVETPWQELCTLPVRNPLHSTIELSLALDPWYTKEFSQEVEILKENRYYYHMYLMDKCGFLLDNRTAVYFRDDNFDVSYSWGSPKFKYAQYIHVTGAYIAELRDTGDFFLAPNNSHVARVNLNIGNNSENISGGVSGAYGAGVGSMGNTMSDFGAANKSAAVYFDSQRVMLDFRSICQDAEKLRLLFREAITSWKNNNEANNALIERFETM